MKRSNNLAAVTALIALATLIPANAVEILSVLRPADVAALVSAEAGIKTAAEKHQGSASKDDAASAKLILALLAAPRDKPGDRLALEGKWQVRSLQVNDLGAYTYPFFPCEFRRESAKGLNLLKNSGSQRRGGIIGDDGKGNFIFIGGKYYQGEAPVGYSGYQDESVKTDPKRDSYGTLHRLGKNHLILIFGETTHGREIYEFKRKN